jgi:ABC-2 type transport system permease protein
MLRRLNNINVFAEKLLVNSVVLVSAMLLAVQARLQLSYGLPLSPEYRAQNVWMYLLIALSLVLVIGFSSIPSGYGAWQRWRTNVYVTIAVSALFAAVCIGVLLPDISQLQLVYFVFFSGLLSLLYIALPRRIYLGQRNHGLWQDIQKVWRSRSLFRIWLTYNIQTRYSQRWLGVLWIIIIPISTAIVLTIAFTRFMRIQLDVPFISFYLAALIPYNVFSNGLIFSGAAITGKIGIITQVYFPREILVLLVLGELLVDFFFAFLAMLFINALAGVGPNVYFFYIVILLIIQIMMSLGFMFIISSTSVLVRDIPQLVSVVMQLVFFMTPIIYPIETVSEQFRFLAIVNPIAPVIQGFRDIIVYARPPDWVSLYFPLVFSVSVLVIGYCTFKAIENEMADIL